MNTCVQTLKAEQSKTTGFARPYGYRKPGTLRATATFMRDVGRLLGIRSRKPVAIRIPPSAR